MPKTPGGKVRREARPDLQRGDRVAVHEQGIATWTGTVQTVKPSHVSGWWVEVEREPHDRETEGGSMKLNKGKQYRVLVSGCSLEGMKSLGNSAWQPTAYKLAIGEVIEFTGMQMGFGSDSIPLPRFTSTLGPSGEFWPTTWGQVSDGTLIEQKEEA